MGLFSHPAPPAGAEFSAPAWQSWFSALRESLVRKEPLAVPSYTLTTLPSASAYSGKYIDVSNATGGAKLCRSNGTNWLLVNTATVVS